MNYREAQEVWVKAYRVGPKSRVYITRYYSYRESRFNVWMDYDITEVISQEPGSVHDVTEIVATGNSNIRIRPHSPRPHRAIAHYSFFVLQVVK